MKILFCRSTCGPSLSVIIFAVFFAFTACKKQDHPQPPQPPAKGTLVNENGGCYPYLLHGVYYNGVPTQSDTANYIEIYVNVTTPGSYKITTDQQKGVSWSGSGVFPDTGVTRVKLMPTGAFSEHTYADFTTSFDSSHCFFRIPIHDSAALGIADNTWEFTAAGRYYHGAISGVDLYVPGGEDPTTFYGSMQGYSDTSLTIFINYSVYDTLQRCYHSTANGAFVDFVTSRFSPDPKIHLHVDRYSAALGAEIKVGDPTGCSPDIFYFNGTILDSANHVIPITNARFRCTNIRQDYLH